MTLGGRRMAVSQPRVRAVDGSGELPVATYGLFSSTEVLGRIAMEKMLAGLSTRHHPVGLKPVDRRVDEVACATSKSAVSRKFVAMTETALAELLTKDLSGLDLVALLVDGVHFAKTLSVVALGIDIERCQAPVGPGGGRPAERGLDAGCESSGAGGYQRVQGAASRGTRRTGAPVYSTLPNPQS